MKKYASIIGAGIGWAAGGPLGAALGYFIGKMMNSVTAIDMSEFNQTNQQTQPGDFEISLLFLSAVVLKADGKIDEAELKFVRNYFKQMYGEERANNAFKLFKEIIKENNVTTQDICLQIKQHMNEASRLQLLHYLFSIAKADGQVTDDEVAVIKTIAGYLGIGIDDYESIKAMFYNDADAAYKILEIEKTADVNTIKTAYRTLAKKHHPDKVAHLGEEHFKGAQEKFLKIQEAYEKIKTERGF